MMKPVHANYQFGVFFVDRTPLKNAQPVSAKEIMEAAANMENLKLTCKIDSEDLLATVETAIYYHDAVS